MSDKNLSNDYYLFSSLRKKGFVIPKSETEVDEFENALKEHKIPPLPDHLKDTEEILKKAYSQPKDLLSTNENQDKVNLARAAREGKKIPASVLEKMLKDKKNARK